MTVYVDKLFDYPKELCPKGRGTKWCHMWTDGHISELHAMADRIGLRREWFQDNVRLPHYDLVPSKRAMAIKLGAVTQDLAECLKTRRSQQ